MLGLLFFISCQQVYPSLGTSSSDAPKQWEALLLRISSPTGVDYPMLQKNRSILDNYMSWLALHGPHSNNYSIREEKRTIAYYANAYNAAVLFGVLEHWPISSVRDVDAGSFSQENIGFFLGQLFVIDGGNMSLFHLEQDLLLGQYQDPRIHAMLNCASIGCPPLRYWHKKNMHTDLNTHWTEFIQNNIRPTSTGWEVSELFFWYKQDFIAWTNAPNLCIYLSYYVHDEAKEWLQKQNKECSLTSFPYDWSLNDSPDVHR